MQTDLEEGKRDEEVESKHSLQSSLSRGDETDYFECQAAQIEIEEVCPYVTSSPDDDGNVETLTAVIKNLKVTVIAALVLKSATLSLSLSSS